MVFSRSKPTSCSSGDVAQGGDRERRKRRKIKSYIPTRVQRYRVCSTYRFKCGSRDGWFAVAVAIVAPRDGLPLHYFNVYRLSRKNTGYPRPPPPRRPFCPKYLCTTDLRMFTISFGRALTRVEIRIARAIQLHARNRFIIIINNYYL